VSGFDGWGYRGGYGPLGVASGHAINMPGRMSEPGHVSVMRMSAGGQRRDLKVVLAGHAPAARRFKAGFPSLPDIARCPGPLHT
jgi:hypothetical protein